METTLNSDLAQRIRRQCGENVFLCYQCAKCASGCPVAEHFDLLPNELLRALQIGRKDAVLKSRTLWLCAMCETCAVRCPHGINITRVMDVLKIMAQEEGMPSPLPSAVIFNHAALRGIRLFGKMYEAGLMGELYLRQMAAGTLDYRQLIKRDLPLALRMIGKRKLKLLPAFARAKAPATSLEKREGPAYYPGCSHHGTAVEYDMSARAALSALGVTLVEPEGWNCCGSTPAHCTDHYLSVSLPLRNILAMERAGFSHITTPCPSCFIRLRTAQRESGEEGLRERLLADLGEIPSPELTVDHLLQTVTGRIGLKKVKDRVVRPFTGLKVVCYYGCIITRPPDITGVRDYEYPTDMDALVRALGADPLDWSYKTRCCGGSLGISRPAIALELIEKILQNARDVGAAAIVVACPLCQINLDARQAQISQESGKTFDLPVVYFTQMMGLAFGLGASELGLDKLFVD
ncbi:MAG: heterodisulfide reductase-related iron-sulfur binding cluster, partial [Thermodesulfobacteriota bacterium]